MSRVELTSPLSPAECRDRLERAIRRPSTWSAAQEVTGSLRGLRLRASKRIGYRNSFQTFMTADLSEAAGGTRLSCRFGMHPFVIVFLVFWCGMLGSFGIGSLIQMLWALLSGALLSGRGIGDGAWQFALVPTGMMLFGILLAVVGRAIAGSERQFLLDFLARTIDAHPATADAAYSA